MTKSFITGCAGPRLSREERSLLADALPWGLILFARNCREPAEISDLVAGFRDVVGSADAPVFIDQEGGRVQRLAPPRWPAYPPARALGAIAERDWEAGQRATFLGARLIAAGLRPLGITVDCLPVLDVPSADGHPVIGDRAYGDSPELIAALGRAAADGLLAGGVLPVIKHIPGHGRAGADSHLALPVVDAGPDLLERIDFRPFRDLRDLPIAMTAHVVFSRLDPVRPATTSPRIIAEVIRGAIGFEGLLISDDLSMQALSGDLPRRTREALEAGCDVVLHCNGDFAEMRAVEAAAPELAGEPAARAAAALARLKPPQPLDLAAAQAEFAALLAGLPAEAG